MPRVGLVFDLRHCQTQPGESLCVRGNVERLGAWSAEGRDDSLRLHTDHKRYPRWSSRAPIWLEAEALPEEDFKFSFRYKYVKDRRCFCDKPYGRSAFVWEGSISDRCICLPVQDGAVFLVSDEIWDEEGQTIITQLRRSKVHMPTTLQPQDNCSFVLSPRAREKEEEDTQFPIEIEFGALDVEPKVETKYTFMEKQAEALKLENVVLRKRLQNLEAAMKLELCNYSGYKIYPGHGKRYVRLDGKVFNFLNKKCERALLMHRNPRKITWTVLYRRKHKKGTTEEVSKKRTRRNVKFQRSVQGATLENILAKRNQKPEVRKAQREQAIRAAKEKSRAKEQQKKATKAQQQQPIRQKQKAAKPVQTKAPRVGGKR